MKRLITILLFLAVLTGCVSSQQRESFSHIKPLVIGQKFNPDAIQPLPEIVPLEEPALSYEVAVIERDVPMLQSYTQEDLRCLARNIYFESGGEPTVGQAAVAYVTLNRVADSRFPKSICAVVKQRHRGVCQFSWVCTKNGARIPAARYEQVVEVAQAVLRGEIPNPVGQSLFFHNNGVGMRVRGTWSSRHRFVSRVGNHYFYAHRTPAAQLASI